MELKIDPCIAGRIWDGGTIDVTPFCGNEKPPVVTIEVSESNGACGALMMHPEQALELARMLIVAARTAREAA